MAGIVVNVQGQIIKEGRPSLFLAGVIILSFTLRVHIHVLFYFLLHIPLHLHCFYPSLNVLFFFLSSPLELPHSPTQKKFLLRFGLVAATSSVFLTCVVDGVGRRACSCLVYNRVRGCLVFPSQSNTK